MAEQWIVAPVVDGRAEWEPSALRKLRKLHKPPRSAYVRPWNCAHCGWPWPCPSLRAVERAET